MSYKGVEGPGGSQSPPRDGCALHGECEIDVLKSKLHLAQKALFELWESSGSFHDDDMCPEDDTCTCPTVARFEEAMKGYESDEEP